ncbi:hypothetical protein CPS_1692 [Colwellia psychrerythraea 34H]|uniref:Uncharacterized protein n=1 Tax=Colwellia psychrerythraea (strain 34H / ATCC BAA-681) TaxID=167879 RepID=Q484T5_COLP3|nr:hypothetical protein CPS_1692 [Colwellia psychrerythraea 34H]
MYTSSTSMLMGYWLIINHVTVTVFMSVLVFLLLLTYF